MIRFAVPPIGGNAWLGGWNYMRNLVRTLSNYGDPAIETLLFMGPDRANDPSLAVLSDLPRTRIITDPAFAEHQVRAQIGRTLVTGRNRAILDAYRRERIDIALAPATYLGWRSEIPSIAWFPDFQHRRMPHMFSRSTWWKRELGFRAQIASSAKILLSSDDAERDCLRYYPATRGRTSVARFSVPLEGWPDADTAWQRLRSEGWPENYVFLPNQFWQHKNHELAIDAAALLAKRGSSRVILATGNPNDPRFPGYFSALQRRISQSGASTHIRVIGQVEYSLVQALLIGANALLNPSRFEGWSTTIEEAKSVGTPMLLSDLAVHKEQAPSANFFPIDDAKALADSIEASPPRKLDEIREAILRAGEGNISRARNFAEDLKKVIFAVQNII